MEGILNKISVATVRTLDFLLLFLDFIKLIADGRAVFALMALENLLNF